MLGFGAYAVLELLAGGAGFFHAVGEFFFEIGEAGGGEAGLLLDFFAGAAFGILLRLPLGLYAGLALGFLGGLALGLGGGFGGGLLAAGEFGFEFFETLPGDAHLLLDGFAGGAFGLLAGLPVGLDAGAALGLLAGFLVGLFAGEAGVGFALEEFLFELAAYVLGLLDAGFGGLAGLAVGLLLHAYRFLAGDLGGLVAAYEFLFELVLLFEGLGFEAARFLG